MTRVALVTGGTRGIGRATAVALAAAGNQVVVTGRSDPADLPAGLAFVAADVTDPDGLDEMVQGVREHHGPVEILVSNAGVTDDALAVRMDEDAFARVIDTNLTGGFRVARRVLRDMMKRRWGRIIFVSSVVGHMGQTGQANYAASKSGLLGLARTLAREYASRGVTVNVVAPGPIETDMLATMSNELREQIPLAVPLGRVGQPEEVAAAIAFLASDDASFITGALVPVDGGFSMGI